MRKFKMDCKIDASPKAAENEEKRASPVWNKIEDSHHVEFAVNEEPSLVREHIHSLIDEFKRKRGSQLAVKPVDKAWYERATAQEKYIADLSKQKKPDCTEELWNTLGKKPQRSP